MDAVRGPLILEPRLVPLIWGGETLVRRFGKRGDPTQAIGESWECWDRNRIAAGALVDATVAEARASCGAALMGRLDATAPFPLLTKLIDARQSLSVQVHPDDAYARRVERQPNGKTECWYVLEASPQAQLILGWTRDVTREEYLARVADGSLGEVLRGVPIAPGDVFFLPAGTLHAIGAGIVLFEMQQTSDLTYRIFDWNRVGADGRPRPLHVDRAADVLDYRASRAGAILPLTFAHAGAERAILIGDRRFSLERIRFGGERFGHERYALARDDAPLVVQTLDRGCAIDVAGGSYALEAYASAIVPASLEATLRSPLGEEVTVLLARPFPDRQRLIEEADSAGVALSEIETFLARFAA